MKFSKSSRDVFEVTQFTPGAGYYVSHDMGEKLEQQKQKQLLSGGEEKQTCWPKGQRFKKDQYILNNNPAPGQYSFQSDFSKTKFQEKQIIQRKIQSSEDSMFKVNAIPSIPSGNQVPGYQEIGDGLLILMKEPRKDKFLENVGPGSYNPNVLAIKKKAQGFLIKKDEIPVKQTSINNQEFIINQDDQQNKQTLKEFLKLQPLSSHTFSPQNKKQNNSFVQQQQQQQQQNPKQHQESKKSFSRSNTTQNLQQKKDPLMNTDYNLELLVLREKNLSKYNNEIPPVGYYFDPAKDTCIKTQKKPLELQCFDSSAPRFNYQTQLNPGVGDYELLHIDAIGNSKNSLPINKQARVGIFKESFTPSPGQYEANLLNFKQSQTSKNNNNLSHPSVFGSGSTRFNPEKLITPGVGTYEYDKNKYAKKKKIKTIIMQQNSNNSYNGKVQLELVVQHDGISEQVDDIEDDVSRNEVIEKFKQIQSKGSSSFKSNVKRFTEQQIKKQDQFNIIGPGSYDLRIDLQLRTHNQQQNPMIDRQMRKFNGGQKGLKCVPKDIGPGSYNENLNAVKQKKTYDIKLH